MLVISTFNNQVSIFKIMIKMIIYFINVLHLKNLGNFMQYFLGLNMSLFTIGHNVCLTFSGEYKLLDV